MRSSLVLHSSLVLQPSPTGPARAPRPLAVRISSLASLASLAFEVVPGRSTLDGATAATAGATAATAGATAATGATGR